MAQGGVRSLARDVSWAAQRAALFGFWQEAVRRVLAGVCVCVCVWWPVCVWGTRCRPTALPPTGNQPIEAAHLPQAAGPQCGRSLWMRPRWLCRA